MNSIETEFLGITYRSRTEARWAVLMHELGVKFHYEAEAFDLSEAGYYLPDFWLPELDLFIEIKPIVSVDGRSSPTQYLCMATEKNVITFCGPPSDPSIGDFREDGFVDVFYDGTVGWDSHHWFCLCPKCGRAGIEFMGRSDRIKCRCQKSIHADKGYNWDDAKLLDAFIKSQTAFRWSPKRRRI